MREGKNKLEIEQAKKNVTVVIHPESEDTYTDGEHDVTDGPNKGSE